MDFTGWTCEQLWDFIENPENDALDRSSALSAWGSTTCGVDHPGASPASGGGRVGGLPPHG